MNPKLGVEPLLGTSTCVLRCGPQDGWDQLCLPTRCLNLCQLRFPVLERGASLFMNADWKLVTWIEGYLSIQLSLAVRPECNSLKHREYLCSLLDPKHLTELPAQNRRQCMLTVSVLHLYVETVHIALGMMCDPWWKACFRVPRRAGLCSPSPGAKAVQNEIHIGWFVLLKTETLRKQV